MSEMSNAEQGRCLARGFGGDVGVGKLAKTRHPMLHMQFSPRGKQVGGARRGK